MEVKKLLGLCMIARDEADFIKPCIESVKDITDEIVVIDTGSADQTPAIAEELGAKVYNYKWDNSFSRARNFAMSKCEAKWLLLLDADESLFDEDKEKLLDFIKGGKYDGALFTVYNYVGDGTTFNIHNALRLIKNDGSYRFRGDIHEQIERTDGGPTEGRFALSGIRLRHYGYLNSVLKKKNKRERNIPILLRELEKDPDDAFMLFNLGNEYMALGDLSTAWGCFGKSMRFAKSSEAFCPHLYFRSAICLKSLSRGKEALGVLEKGLRMYPGCTDMELLRGCIYCDLRLDLLAIKSFEKAIAMGEPHPTLKFTEDCHTTKPLMALAEVYIRQRDLAAAEQACLKALSLNGKLYAALYKLSEIAKLRGDSKEQTAKRLEALFSNPSHPANLVMLADIMLYAGFSENAENYLKSLEAASKHEGDFKILNAKLHFLKGEHGEACRLLNDFYGGGMKTEVLTDLNSEAALLLCCENLIKLFKGEEDNIQEALTVLSGESQKLVMLQSRAILMGSGENLLGSAEANSALDFLGEIIKRILSCKEFDLFEKLLYNYNYIPSKKALLHLAKVYRDCGYPDFAYSAVLRSVKELGEIDADGARILLDCLVETG